MSGLNFAETLSIWILGTVAIYGSGFVYQRLWRYVYRRLGWPTRLQTEQGDEERTIVIAWGSGLAVACFITWRIQQLEPLHKGLVIFGSPLAILVCGFLGLSVPEIWAIWRKYHK
ncbi:MAG: hypothetical protein BWY63_01229 [Chloroflexi bacterium ADurb.Bin360]|nr:MAG: hypothetical protein BWY63_01229 [Chloroflexi bacterium ADurb.Bin360]